MAAANNLQQLEYGVTDVKVAEIFKKIDDVLTYDVMILVTPNDDLATPLITKIDVVFHVIRLAIFSVIRFVIVHVIRHVIRNAIRYLFPSCVSSLVIFSVIRLVIRYLFRHPSHHL